MNARLVGISAGTLVLHAMSLSAQAPASASVTPNRWNIDASHSAVTFRVRHLGLSWVNGSFQQWTGELVYDPANPEAASVKVRIQTPSVDTGNERRDNDVRTNYLVTDSFPEMTYVSRSVERAGADKLRITGDLTIRGITRPAVLDAEVLGTLSGQRGRRISFSAATTINRQEFGVTRNPFMEGAQVVGDDVRVTIDLEATEPPPAPRG